MFMERTKVPVARTLGSITDCLIQAGATEINTSYANAKPTAVRFTLPVKGTPVLFQLPARVDPVFEKLTQNKKANITRDDAERIAWRQLFRWVEAQMAMVDCGMATAPEVFMPYCARPDGVTLFEIFLENGSRLLTAGGSE